MGAKSKKKRAGFWKSYDARYRNNDQRGIFLQVMLRVTQLDPPYRLSGRGKKPAITPHEAAAFELIRIHFDLVYRDLEGLSDQLLGRHVDHSTFHEHITRIPPEYMKRVGEVLDEEIRERLGSVTWFFIADSTKVRLDRQFVTRQVAMEELRVADLQQLHTFAGYAPEVGVITIPRAHVGVMGEVSAVRAEIATLPQGFLAGRGFFADRGYDAEALFRDIFAAGGTPFIKQRDLGTTRAYRGKAQRAWDLDAYKEIRALVEGIYGGLETRNSLHSRSRLPPNKERDTHTLAASHNLQALLRVLTFKEVGMPSAG